MKKLAVSVGIVLTGITLSFQALACGDDKKKMTFDMELQQGTLVEAAALVNTHCAKDKGTIKVKNPGEKLNIKAKGLNCDEATKMILEFDQGAV